MSDREQRRLAVLGFIPFAGIVLFIGISPFGSALLNSFFIDIYGQRSFAGISHYREILADRGFSLSLNITILWSLANTVLSLGIGFLFAVCLFIAKRRISRLLYIFILVPWGIPVYMAVPIWRAFLYGSGGRSLFSFLTGIKVDLMNDAFAGFASTIAVSTWLTIPLTAFVLLGAMRKIPASSIQAAQIDGAGEADLVRHIILPGSRDALLVMGVLNFIKSLKEFTVVYMMTAGGPPLVSGTTSRGIIGATTVLDIYLFDIFQGREDLGVSAAYSLVASVIVVAVMVFWFFIRQRNGNPRNLLIYAALLQIPFNFPFGLIFAAGYGIAIFYRKAAGIVLAAQLIFTAFRIAQSGFLSGLSPGLIIAAGSLILLATHKAEAGNRGARRTASVTERNIFPSLHKPLWYSFSRIIPVIFSLTSLLLVYMLVWMSFSELSVSHVDSIIPRFFSLTSYSKVVVDEHVFRYFLNTIFVALACAVLVPAVTVPAAFYLSGRRKRESKGILTTVQALGIAGGMQTLIPLYIIFLRLRLIDNYLSLILLYTYHALPFALITTMSYLSKIPKSFRDIAVLEGTGPFRYVIGIIIPVSLPIITTSAVVAFLGAWNGFMAPLLFINDDSKYTISVKLFSLVGSLAGGSPRWNLFAAASFINLVILTIIFLLFRRPIQTTSLEEVEE